MKKMINSNKRKTLNVLSVIMIFTFIFVFQGDCKCVKAEEATEEFIDIANSSVSYNGEICDIVTWKIKLLKEFEVTKIDLTLKAPNGNIITVNWDSSHYELDENGCYTIEYFVPEYGPGDGVYQINQLEIYDCSNSSNCISYTITNGQNGVDLSSLSFRVSGQEKDATPPKIDKNNIVICREDYYGNGGDEICVEIPVEEEESGIQEIWVGWYYYLNDYFNNDTGSWLEDRIIGTIRGTAYLDPLNVFTETRDFSDFKEDIVYGIGYVKVIDWAGNTSIVNLLNENVNGIDALPEKYRFTTSQIHVHTYSDNWTVDVQPTCGEVGIKSRHCTEPNCNGKTDFEEIDETFEHVFGEWVIKTQPTGNTTGVKERICSVCGLEETEEIPATGEIKDETPITPPAQDTKPTENPITPPADNNSKSSDGDVNNNTNTVAAPAKKGSVLNLESLKCKVKVVSDNVANPTVSYLGTTSKSATTVKVPDTVIVDDITYTVTAIADKAFSGNKKIKNVTIGKNVTSVGKDAFKNCTKLKKVEIQSQTLNKIGSNAFSGDKSLTKISIKSTKLTKYSVGKNALKGTNKKLVITVPKSKVKDYRKYFQNKGNKVVKVKK